MSSAAFTTFSAISATEGGAVTCSWTFDPSYVTLSNAKHIYLYQTDTSLNDTTVELGQTYVVPLIDPDTGLLTTTFTVPGLTNGWTYLFSGEVTVKPTLTPNAPNTTSVYNSATVSAIPTTEPACPYFVLSQIDDFSFTVQLSVDSSSVVVTPTPISDFDGYSELTGVYVVYSNGSSIKTDYFANDSSTNVYTDPLTVDVSDGYYEVAISTENIAANGTFRRSCLSFTQYIFVNEEPGAPQDVSAVQQIVVDASGTPPYIELTWNPPTYLGNPHLDSYYIFRSLDASYEQIAIVDASTNAYTDDSDSTVLIPGTNYTYQIYAHNTDGLSDAAGISNSVLAWIYPNQVLNLQLITDSSSSLIAQWVSAGNDTGLPAGDLVYELVLTDASGVVIYDVVTSDVSYSFTGLEIGEQFNLTVYAGVTFNSVDYFNPVDPATATGYTYGTPLPPRNLRLYNHSPIYSLQGVWDAPDPSGMPVDGLTFVDYTTKLDDASVTTTVYQQQVFPDLNAYQTYNVKVYANYIITALPSVFIQSTYVEATGIPHPVAIAPVLTATATNTEGAGGTQEGQTVLLSWTLDSNFAYSTSTDIWRQISDVSGTVLQAYVKIATVGDYVDTYIDQDQGDASSVYFINGNTMTYYVNVTYTEVTYNPNTTFDVSSNESSTIPYTVPPAPSSLIVDELNTQLELLWDLSNNYSETGLILIGYKMYLDASYIGVELDSTYSSYIFTGLTNGVQYAVGVQAIYTVNSILVSSAVSSVNGTPRETTDANLTATATNTENSGAQLGQLVKLNWNIDSGSYTSSTQVYRKITDVCGNEVAPYQLVVTLGDTVDYYNDDGSGNSDYFLNGNLMTYYVVISYTGGSDPYIITSSEASATPYAAPSPCDASGNPVDLSMCIVPTDLSGNTFTTFTSTFTKNGSNIADFISVGLAANGSAPYKILNLTNSSGPDYYVINYSNPVNLGVCALNQVAQVTLSLTGSGSVNLDLSDVLNIIVNPGGALVASYPSDGAFNI